MAASNQDPKDLWTGVTSSVFFWKGVCKTCLMECKPHVFKGGGRGDTMMYGGGISQSTINQQFRGWGFTFL